MEVIHASPESKAPPSPEILMASILERVAENAYDAEEVLDQTGTEPLVLAPTIARIAQQVHLDDFNAHLKALTADSEDAEESVIPTIDDTITRKVRTWASNREQEGFNSTVTEPSKKTQLLVSYTREFSGDPIHVSMEIHGITTIVTKTNEDGTITRTTTTFAPSSADKSNVIVGYDVTTIDETGKESLYKKIDFKLMPGRDGYMVKKPFTRSRGITI